MITKASNIALSVIVCFFINQINGQKNPTLKLKQDMQSLLDSLQETNGFPGATFCVILPNSERILLSSGIADSTKGTPMKTTHRMLSGSNGKTLFIAAALILASKNYYQLDDKIEKFIGDEPWFNRLPNANAITLRMLMNHTSGLEEYYELGDFMSLVKQNPNRSFSPIETFSYLFDREPLFEAGTAWGYADTNFILLGYILEKITNKKMYDLVQLYVIDPYQLRLTEPSIKRNFDNLAVGYSRKGGPFPFEGAMVQNDELVFNPQFEWMGGGFISNVTDLATWIKELYNSRTINKNILEQMNVKIPANTGKNHAYGLGIQIRPSTKMGDSFGHSGWFPGYLTDAVYFPNLKLALAIQFNTDDISKLKMLPYDYLLLMAELVTNNIEKEKR